MPSHYKRERDAFLVNPLEFPQALINKWPIEMQSANNVTATTTKLLKA